MNTLYYITLFLLTIGTYFSSLWIVKKLKIKFLHPVILSTIAIITFLIYTDTPYLEYYNATRPISWLLGPSVVALGWVMYNNIKELKSNLKTLLFSTFIGSITSILLVIGLAEWWGLPEIIKYSLVPKSITTPLAMQVSEMVGGNPALTIAVVVVTGIIGVLISPIIYSMFRIKSPVAQGLGLGVASHAIGTASALELGALQGAVGGMAIGVMGIFTSIFAPLICLVF